MTMTENTPQHKIGIDIGGSSIKGGLVDLATGSLLGNPIRIVTPTPATPHAVADVVVQIVEQLEKRMDVSGPDSAVGVTYPGIIRHGVSRSAANMDSSWIGFDVETLFTDRLGRPVEVVNDADAAGLAEVRYGAGKGFDGTVLVITLGTGIGSAFVYDGKLVPNSELGHLEVDGSKAESKASAVARERNGLSWEEYSGVLQRYLAHVEFLFSPELFIIGGGISVRADEYLPKLDLKTPTVQAELKNDAGIVGAAIQGAVRQAPSAETRVYVRREAIPLWARHVGRGSGM